MNWVKVAQALDDEWHSKRKLAEQARDSTSEQRTILLSLIAFMLRDCLVAGMPQKDRDRVFDRSE